MCGASELGWFGDMLGDSVSDLIRDMGFDVEGTTLCEVGEERVTLAVKIILPDDFRISECYRYKPKSCEFGE